MLATLAVGLTLGAAPSGAAPPLHAVVVPSQSLGGLRLGATEAAVRRAWGREHGSCRACNRPTWYFNYVRYRPQGAGVEFRAGRVAALFTLWSPSGWRTREGLRIGDPSIRIMELYGALARRDCPGYYALELRQRRTVTAFYVVGEKVWGFGLSRPSIPTCR